MKKCNGYKMKDFKMVTKNKKNKKLQNENSKNKKQF